MLRTHITGSLQCHSYVAIRKRNEGNEIYCKDLVVSYLLLYKSHTT